MPSDTETTYCHVCLGDVPTCKVAKCPNGHACCEKHHIQRIKAIYEGGKHAFDGVDGGEGEQTGQMCFMCRCPMPDANFTENYFKMLRLCITIEMPKAKGVRIDNETIEMAVKVMKMCKDNQSTLPDLSHLSGNRN